MKPSVSNIQKWTILSTHPSVRKLYESDDEHFTGYKGLLMTLDYPREYYGVIGTRELPLRLVCPDDWIITRVDGTCISVSENFLLEHYPELIK